MQRVGIFKSSVLVDIANWAGLPLLAIYCLSMFVCPWFNGNWSWNYVQEVWDRWQTFNAGALAFAASLVAFNISRFNENRQRERDFAAATAFLPSTLSGLMEYCAQSARILTAMWERLGPAREPHELPVFPQDYREVFSNCIRHADPEVGSYLSNILVRLQVHDARLRDAVAEHVRAHTRLVDRHTLIAYALRIGEIYALMGNLFGFARGEEEFQPKQLTWDDLRSAYSILEIELENFHVSQDINLEVFTRSWLVRTEGDRPPRTGDA